MSWEDWDDAEEDDDATLSGLGTLGFRGAPLQVGRSGVGQVVGGNNTVSVAKYSDIFRVSYD
jgi:hypothetical protein